MSAAADVTQGENVASGDMLAPTHWEVRYMSMTHTMTY